jgi:hypothetical protein
MGALRVEGLAADIAWPFGHWRRWWIEIGLDALRPAEAVIAWAIRDVGSHALLADAAALLMPCELARKALAGCACQSHHA